MQILLVLAALLPFGGFELLLAAPLLWWLSAPRWHPLLAVVFLCGLVIAIVAIARHLRRDAALNRDNPYSATTCRWNPGNSAEAFATRLKTFLTVAGWQVLSSSVNPQLQVRMAARKARWTIELLCIGPEGSAASPEELRRLAGLAGPVRGAIVAPRGMTIGGDHARDVARLQYEDMSRLEEVLGLDI